MKNCVLLVGQPRTWMQCKASLLEHVIQPDDDVIVVTNTMGLTDKTCAAYTHDVMYTFQDRLKSCRDVYRDPDLVLRWQQLLEQLMPKVQHASLPLNQRRGEVCYGELCNRGTPDMTGWLVTNGLQFFATDVALETLISVEQETHIQYDNIIRTRPDLLVHYRFTPVAPDRSHGVIDQIRQWTFGSDQNMAKQWEQLYGVLSGADLEDTYGDGQRVSTLHPWFIPRERHDLNTMACSYEQAF